MKVHFEWKRDIHADEIIRMGAVFWSGINGYGFRDIASCTGILDTGTCTGVITVPVPGPVQLEADIHLHVKRAGAGEYYELNMIDIIREVNDGEGYLGFTTWAAERVCRHAGIPPAAVDLDKFAADVNTAVYKHKTDFRNYLETSLENARKLIA